MKTRQSARNSKFFDEMEDSQATHITKPDGGKKEKTSASIDKVFIPYQPKGPTANSRRGRKGSREALAQSSKKKRKPLKARRDKSLPPVGTFNIPPGLKRVEASPMSDRPQQNVRESPESNNQKYQAKKDKQLPPVGTFIISPSKKRLEAGPMRAEAWRKVLPLPDCIILEEMREGNFKPDEVDEETHCANVAKYEKETGGMGGLPLL